MTSFEFSSAATYLLQLIRLDIEIGFTVYSADYAQQKLSEFMTSKQTLSLYFYTSYQFTRLKLVLHEAALSMKEHRKLFSPE